MGLNLRGTSFGLCTGAEYFNALGDTADTLSIPAGTRGCLVSVIGTEPIKWRVDGIAPTATIGHPLSVGGHVEIFRDDMGSFKMISGTVATATQVFVSYFGEV